MVQDARRQLVWLVAVVVVEATQKNTTREAVEDTAGRDDAGRKERSDAYDERMIIGNSETSHEEQLELD